MERKARGRVNRVPLPPVQSEEQTREEDTDEQLEHYLTA